MAYLIACSAAKEQPTQIRPSNLQSLYMSDQLTEARARLIRLKGISLDWERTLPAWQLYRRGVLFRQVAPGNWLRGQTDVKILSTLFGWVRHTDLLPYYTLKMDDKFQLEPGDYIFVQKYWRDLGILRQGVDPHKDVDLLFDKCRIAIHGNKGYVALPPNETFKDNYGTGKGRWLNQQLSL